MSRIRSAFDVELPLKTLFEAPTLEELARAITEAQAAGQTAMPPLVAQPRPELLPLSFAQQRLWFLDQLEPGSAAYNLPAALRLRGRLDVEALRRTVEAMVERHEALRTTFVSDGGEPVQKIHAATAWALPCLDLDSAEEMEARAQAEAAQPFDLASGPLLRTTLLRLGDEDHVLLVTMHHIVSDGWSIAVMVREMMALYPALAQGSCATLAPLPVQYGDFALWQRSWLQGDVLEQQLAYWRERLTGVPPLELPTDRPRPAIASHRGALHGFVLPATLTAKLRRLGQEHGATLYMTLLAGFETLLYRYTGQKDFAIGAPIANRTDGKVEALIGCFVNTLALRADLDGDPTFVELLGRVREQALGGYAHQAAPFERLVDELGVERDLSRSPLFQVSFVLQNAPAETLVLEGVTLEALPLPVSTAKFDLTVTLEERGGELGGSVEYATDLFDASTIARLARHFGRLLDGISGDPQRRVSEIQWLGEEERHELVMTWNETAAEVPQEACIHELFEEQARKTPDATAVEYGEERLTYRELDERSNRLAHYLQSLGVGRDVRVGICVERSLEAMVGLLAIVKAGGAYVPVNPSYPAERIAFLLEDAQVAVLLTQERLEERLPVQQSFVVLLDDDAAWAAERATPVERRASADDVVYVIYTSGSTGRPKGVCVPHRALVNLVSWLAQKWPMTSERMVLKTPLAFDAVGHELWAPLVDGGCIVVAPPGAERDPAALIEVIQRHQVTTLQVVPTLLRALVAEGLAQCASLKRIFCGGEALDAELCRRRARADERGADQCLRPDGSDGRCPVARVAGSGRRNGADRPADRERARLRPRRAAAAGGRSASPASSTSAARASRAAT